jgi:ribosomal protein S18 acetylase RimI-like enzyme
MTRGIIRTARLSDAYAIAAVHVSVSRKTYANLLPPETLDQFSVECRTRQWYETINQPDHNETAVFVAEDAEDRAILGFGCCSLQRSEMLLAKGFVGEFQSIYVLPSAQGCGIGRALMAAMARHLSQLAISGAACWVLRENDRARRFYEVLEGHIVSEQTLGPRTGGLVEVAYGWLPLNLLLGG